MKAFRCLAVLLSISIILMMQACGADTSGSLTMTEPTSTDNGDGTYSVSTTVTYAPPAGKSAQGVVIKTTATDSFGDVTDAEATLTSGSNSVTYKFYVDQYLGVSNRFSILSSIGDMKSSVGIIIPGIAAMSALPINFLDSEAVGTTKTTTIAGGVGTYTLLTSTPVDGVLNISLSDKTLTVVYTSLTTVTQKTTNILIRDYAGSTYSVPVTYYK